MTIVYVGIKPPSVSVDALKLKIKQLELVSNEQGVDIKKLKKDKKDGD